MKEEVPLPAPPQRHPPAFVLGAEQDLLVDATAVRETADAYGVRPVLLQGCAHDVMLVRADLAGMHACTAVWGQGRVLPCMAALLGSVLCEAWE
jgi:pimeloyl-ACP methyl ester carboxylesterase